MGNARKDADLKAKNCAFCRIARGEDPDAFILYRNAHCVAFFPDNPATLGHTLLMPRAHVPDIWSLTESEAVHLTQFALKIAPAIRQSCDTDALNIIQSNGHEATQTVWHLHVHLVPRYPNDLMGPLWPEGAPVKLSAKQIIFDRIRSRLDET